MSIYDELITLPRRKFGEFMGGGGIQVDNPLRVAFDGSNYADFTVDGGGDLTIAPSGADTSVTGDLFVSANLDVTGAGYFSQYIYHTGDTDTYFRFQADRITLRTGGRDMLDIVEGATDYVQVLERLRVAFDGSNYADFTVSSGGDLTIAPTGADTNLTGDLFVSANLDVTGAGYFTEYIYHTGDTDTYFRFQADRITLRAGGKDMLDIVEGATDYVRIPDKLFINETSNALQDYGITISDAGTNTEAIVLKDTLKAHGMTSLTETDTIGLMGLIGGLFFHNSYSTETYSSVFQAYYTTGDTTKTVNGIAPHAFFVRKKSGTSYGGVGANENVYVFKGRIGTVDRTLFLIDAEGDLYVDGSTTLTAFDSWDDAALVRALDVVRSPEQVIKSKWDEHVQYNETDLIEAGILGDTVENGGLINVTQLQRLHNGAIWQLATQLMDTKNKINSLESKLKQLEVK